MEIAKRSGAQPSVGTKGNKMSSGVILIILTGWSIMATYHCFRYKNAYWIYPTIVGFKDRKNHIDTKPIYICLGIYMSVWTFIVTAYTAYYLWQVFNVK
jgi:hypothetical protein